MLEPRRRPSRHGFVRIGNEVAIGQALAGAECLLELRHRLEDAEVVAKIAEACTHCRTHVLEDFLGETFDFGWDFGALFYFAAAGGRERRGRQQLAARNHTPSLRQTISPLTIVAMGPPRKLRPWNGEFRLREGD